MCSRELRAQEPEFKPQPGRVQLPKNYSNNSYAHDEQGDNPGQEKDGSTVSSINCDRC